MEIESGGGRSRVPFCVPWLNPDFAVALEQGGRPSHRFSLTGRQSVTESSLEGARAALLPLRRPEARLMGPPQPPSRCADTDQTPGPPCRQPPGAGCGEPARAVRRPACLLAPGPVHGDANSNRSRGLGDTASRLAFPRAQNSGPGGVCFSIDDSLGGKGLRHARVFTAGPQAPGAGAPSGSWGPGEDAPAACAAWPCHTLCSDSDHVSSCISRGLGDLLVSGPWVFHRTHSFLSQSKVILLSPRSKSRYLESNPEAHIPRLHLG